MKYTKEINELIHQLHKLPAIGIKTAEKLALHLINQDSSFIQGIVISITEAFKTTKYCKICHSLTNNDICDICDNSNRDNTMLMITETFREVIRVESSDIYKGRYHVLHGRIEPLNGIMPEDLYLNDILDRIEKEDIKEVIFALSTDTDGNTTAMYIHRLIKEEYPEVKLTQLTTGVPLGSNLDMVDPLTLDRAISQRSDFLV